MDLYKSHNLRVFSVGSPAVRSAVIVSSFQYMLDEPSLDARGFGSAFFEKHDIDAVFINCRTNAWWQYPDLPDALATIREHTSMWSRSITYGSSMGGYAALRFASVVGAAHSIAVSPQYSPRSSVVVGETRYDKIVEDTRFIYEDTYKASPEVKNHIVYDPFHTQDAIHVGHYRAEAPLVDIKAHFGGHSPAIMLDQCGLFTSTILQLVDGSFNPWTMQTLRRQRRTQSQIYKQEIGLHLQKRLRRRAVASPNVALHSSGTMPDASLPGDDPGYFRGNAQNAVLYFDDTVAKCHCGLPVVN